MDNSSNNSGLIYTDFTEIINPVVLFKGIYDSIYIKPTSLIVEHEIGGAVGVFIDWNRNGIFESTERVILFGHQELQREELLFLQTQYLVTQK